MLLRGVVIRKTDSGEHNELVTFYTKDFGKVVGIAKSVKKQQSRQAGHLEVFNLTDFLLVEGKSWPIITSAHSLDNFLHLKKSLLKSAVGFFLLECFHRLVYERERDPVLWGFLWDSLKKLNDQDLSDQAVPALLAGLQRDFVEVLGYNAYPDRLSLNDFFQSLAQKKLYSLDWAKNVFRVYGR